ncbi:MAG TPA: ATP synthase subunit I [Geothrix sp.]|nr:ATP synthase subunit I [Geothrix sp.]
MTPPEDGGEEHLRRVTRAMVILGVAGILLWGFLRSWTAALAFGVGALTSLAFWTLHRVFTGRMLTPSVRRRWLYGLLSMGKLALIALVLRGMMGRYPAEALPLALGVFLFVAGILLEALRLMFQKPESLPPD